jgi:hypothetical protein
MGWGSCSVKGPPSHTRYLEQHARAGHIIIMWVHSKLSPPATMDDGSNRCPVFCTAAIPTTVSQRTSPVYRRKVLFSSILALQTLDLLLQRTEEYFSESRTPSFPTQASDWLVIMDTKDIATITHGSSHPMTSSPTAFLGLSLEEVHDWFITNISQPCSDKFTSDCFLLLDDESTEDNSCIFVCTQDSAPGEIHSLRCVFELAYHNVIACDIQGHSIEEATMGCFMRSGVTMTQENMKLVDSGGLYIEDGEVKLDHAWRDFGDW